jgi:putative oxidoreductase
MGEDMAAAVAQSTEDLGKLVVRVTVGSLILFHAFAFLTGDTGMPNALTAWGLPPYLAWLGFLAEFAGGAAMVLGVYARLGGFMVGSFMIIALIMRHVGLMGAQNHLFMVAGVTPQSHWDHYFLETQFFYLLGSYAVALLGAGRYGLNIGDKWNN